MAGSLNKVTLIGNCGNDPDIRSVGDGRVANLSIATSESWKDKSSGEKKERTEWHRIVVWNEGLVGVIEKYVKKGSKVYIEGELQTRKWEKDGVERHSTEVVLTGFGGRLILLGDGGGGGRQSDPNENSSRPGNDGGGASQRDLDDEIPF